MSASAGAADATMRLGALGVAAGISLGYALYRLTVDDSDDSLVEEQHAPSETKTSSSPQKHTYARDVYINDGARGVGEEKENAPTTYFKYAKAKKEEQKQESKQPDGELSPTEGSVASLSATESDVELDSEVDNEEAFTPGTAMDGKTATALVGYQFSDIHFVYALNEKNEFGEALSRLVKRNVANLDGNVGEVQKLETRQGCGAIVFGTLSAQVKATVFTTSTTLVEQIPTLHKIAASNAPLVIHTAAHHITSDCTIVSDLGEVMTARNTGLTMLAASPAGGAQEIADMALVSHLVAVEASTAVVHFFDNAYAANEVGTVQLPSQHGIRSLQQQIHRLRRGTDGVAEVTEHAFRALEKATGRSYHAVEYFGSPEATSVVVLSAASAAEPTVRSTAEYLYKMKGEPVGVVCIRLHKPLVAAHLLEAFPKTVERVCVLDNTTKATASSGPGPLFEDVTTAIYVHGLGFPISVISGNISAGLTGLNMNRASARAVFTNLMSSNPRSGFTIGAATTVARHPSGNTLDVVQEMSVFADQSDVDASGNEADNDAAEETITVATKAKHQIAWNLMFPEAFGTEAQLRPEAKDPVFRVRLVKFERLTPVDYHRNIFHIEMDTTGSGLTYKIGDSLGVYGLNDVQAVDSFLKAYGLDPNGYVAQGKQNQSEGNRHGSKTISQLFTQDLDLFGKPGKKFYAKLAPFATSNYQYKRLIRLGGEDIEGFKVRRNQAITHADILLEFTSARPSLADLVEMIPAIKPRHYSIASSSKMNPSSVHLLVVAVEWDVKTGVDGDGPIKHMKGQCTRYLADLEGKASQDVNLARDDVFLAVDIMKSAMRLPADPTTPIVMAGLGTGMAPFRAFIQERAVQRAQGIKVGPIVLYFGARHRASEWLYGNELESYERSGLIQLRLAFSRDGPKKVYIQHLITEDAMYLAELLLHQGGHFYLCGPTWPVPDVAAALVNGFVHAGNLDVDSAWEKLDEMKDDGRYVLEVY